MYSLDGSCAKLVVENETSICRKVKPSVEISVVVISMVTVNALLVFGMTVVNVSVDVVLVIVVECLIETHWWMCFLFKLSNVRCSHL